MAYLRLRGKVSLLVLLVFGLHELRFVPTLAAGLHHHECLGKSNIYTTPPAHHYCLLAYLSV